MNQTTSIEIENEILEHREIQRIINATPYALKYGAPIIVTEKTRLLIIDRLDALANKTNRTLPIRNIAPKFVCNICGEQHDSTRSGHCDDCQA